MRRCTIILAVFFVFFHVEMKAQVDREFWFVVPVITQDYPSVGVPSTYLNITAHDLPAHITIDMPKESLFTPITITVPAFTTQYVDLTSRLSIIQDAYMSGGKSNKGLHIVSDNYINVTFESNKANNPETFSLLGRNALGSDFYTSFQTDMMNWNASSWTTQGYSAFDIVFTEDNTTIDVYIPTGQGLYNGSNPVLTGHVVLGPFMRGETFTGIPAWLHNLEQPLVWPRLANDTYGRSAEDHLAGLRIVAQGSKKIAVTLKDDAVKSLVGNTSSPVQCDLLGTQTIPVTMLGKQYIAFRGQMLTGNLATGYYNPPPGPANVNQERLYILGTQNNTDIYVNGTLVATINAGETYVHEVTTDVSVVSSPDADFYCLQVTGIGDELAEAVLPPTDECTGSSQVGFSRPSNTGLLQLNILVRKSAKDSFLLNGAVNALLDPSNFTDISGTDWAYMRNLSVPLTTIPFGSKTIISNTKDLFHVNILNGVYSTSTYLGGARDAWVSDYNTVRFEGFISPSGSSYKRLCYGDTVQLVAHGGTAYNWTPTSYLSDIMSPVPVARPVTSNVYTATISGACGLSDTVQYHIDVALPLEARFNIDTTTACAPYRLSIHDQSFGVKNYSWNLGDGTTMAYGSVETKTADTIFYHTYTNSGSTALTRNIRLIVTNSYSCSDTLQRSFVIRPQVLASFSISPDTVGCHPFTVSFTNSSVNANTYQWTFGDGSSSSSQSVNHTYTNYGSVDSIRQVRMIATSSYYCSDTAMARITVKPFITANFVVSTDRGCSPLQVDITNNSVGGSSIVSYNWNFGDGNTSTSSAATLSHTYTNTTGAIQYRQLKLVIQNTQGCTDTLIRTIRVYPEVSAVFTQDVIQGCNPLSVHFTHPSNLVSVSYNWDFGQGMTSSQADPVASLENPTGHDTSYVTKLIVTSANYCTDTFSRSILVYPYIDASFTIDRDESCVQVPVTITNNSSTLPGITSFKWIFGDGSPDGNSSASSFVHNYTNATAVTQYYNLVMVVSNHAGCTDTLIRQVKVFPEVTSQFTPDKLNGCNPVQINFTNNSNTPVASYFHWDFGDSTSSTLQNPVHQFSNLSDHDTTYTVTLVATSSDFCSDTSVANITVYAYINPDYTVAVPAACSPFALSIDNQSEGGVALYEWDFGDGSPFSALSEPSHTYTNKTLSNEVYNLRLVIKNSHTCYDTLIRQVTVYPEVKAAFSTDVSAGCNPLQVAFTNHSNTPVATTFDWSFGDGATSGLINPDHTFDYTGSSDNTYTIQLHAESAYGCTHDTTGTITVYSYIDADFKMNDPDVCSGYSLRFDNTSIGGISQYDWDFDGNGTTDSNDSSPFFDHVYTNITGNPVTYQVQLKVSNAHNCSDSVTRSLVVYPQVTADFSYDSSGCSPLQVQFQNNTLNGSALLGSSGDYHWDFGDTITSTIQNPLKIFYNYSDFDITRTVKLVASSQWFCVDSVEKTVYVYHKPHAMFSIDKTVSCPPFNLTIQNLSYTTSSSFYWDFGDGQTDTTYTKANEIHTYLNSLPDIKDYTIRMSAVSDKGCADSTSVSLSVYPQVTAGFSYDSAGCSPFVVSFNNQSVNAAYYQWDFKDGTYSIQKDPFKRFSHNEATDQNYQVQLKASSPYGCEDSVSHQVTVFAQPNAEFTASPTHQVYIPEPVVNIENESEHQSVWQYQWDFGDGTNSAESAADFTKTYTYWGPNNDDNRFYITLIAINGSHPQCSDTVQHSIRIIPHEPVPVIITSDTSGCEPYEAQFSMTAEYAYPDSFTWDFGDGSQSHEQSPLHDYQSDGVYQVTLEAVGDGGIAYAYIIVEVYPQPVADFDISPRLVMLPDDQITTIDKSVNAVAWLWDFGDGTTSTEQQPQHLYEQPGIYNIQLIAFSDHGCADTLLKDNFIEAEEAGVLIFPNAFTPNLNGPVGRNYSNLSWANVNDLFYPKHLQIAEYKLEIYSRWGEKLFETNNVNEGWDGYYNGKLCKQDVYVWKASGKFNNGRPFILSGDVTLLHKK